MKTTQTLRFTIAGLIVALVTLISPIAQANCGGCGSGDKKESPSPTPVPSPAK